MVAQQPPSLSNQLGAAVDWPASLDDPASIALPQLRAVTEWRHAAPGFGNLFPQTKPGLTSQVGFYKFPVLGIGDGDLARNRQVVSGLLRASQSSK